MQATSSIASMGPKIRLNPSNVKRPFFKPPPDRLELESTLLSCPEDSVLRRSPMPEDTPGHSPFAADESPIPTNVGDLLAEDHNADHRPEEKTPQNLSFNSTPSATSAAAKVAYFQPTTVLYQEAFKLSVKTPMRFASVANPSAQNKAWDASGGQTPRQLAARLALFVIRFRDFVMQGQPSTGCLSETQQQALVYCLHTYGWQVYHTRLCPPTFSFYGLEQHDFWVLVPPSELTRSLSPELNPEFPACHFVLDFRFSDLFQVARPTPEFDLVFQRLRPEFVGVRCLSSYLDPRLLQDDLHRAIEWIARRARRSLEEQGLTIPPWRHCSFLQAAFDQGTEICSVPLTFEDFPSSAQDLAMTFLKKDNLFLQALGLRGSQKIAFTLAPPTLGRPTPGNGEGENDLSFEKEDVTPEAVTSTLVGRLSAILGGGCGK